MRRRVPTKNIFYPVVLLICLAFASQVSGQSVLGELRGQEPLSALHHVSNNNIEFTYVQISTGACHMQNHVLNKGKWT
jgi:hypothetical protein